MKLRKVKNTCLPIVPSVRLSSYKCRIQKLRNKRNKLRNKRNKRNKLRNKRNKLRNKRNKLRNKRNKLRKRKNTDHAHRRLVKTHEVLKYDLTETSLISNLDSYSMSNIYEILFQIILFLLSLSAVPAHGLMH